MRTRVSRRVAPLALLAGVVGVFPSLEASAADKVETRAPARPAKKAEKVPKSSPRTEAAEPKRDTPAKPAETDAPREAKRTPPAADADAPRSATVKEDAAAGPRQGAGNRSLEPAPPPKDEAAAKDPAKAEPKAAAGRLPHQKGAIPRKPNPSLPKGAARPAPDAAARREVAGGPTSDDLRAGKEDAELRALKRADRVLFPKPLEGARPGWSWDLPEPVENGDAEVVASGLPPDARLGTRPSAEIGAIDAEWIKSLTLPNLPVRYEARVVTYLKFYRDDPQGRSIARVWAQKSGRYAPALRAALSRAGLPTDLLYLSLIESGHNPTIVSAAGAAGLWQFMPDAGRMYGLTVDRWVDERFDAPRATEGAVRYLSDLYRRFGNWDLAMAAYNMGVGGLSRAIKKFNTNDFWELTRLRGGDPLGDHALRPEDSGDCRGDEQSAGLRHRRGDAGPAGELRERARRSGRAARAHRDGERRFSCRLWRR